MLQIHNADESARASFISFLLSKLRVENVHEAASSARPTSLPPPEGDKRPSGGRSPLRETNRAKWNLFAVCASEEQLGAVSPLCFHSVVHGGETLLRSAQQRPLRPTAATPHGPMISVQDQSRNPEENLQHDLRLIQARVMLRRTLILRL